MKNYKNILVVRTDRVGDVVLTTPALEALRKAYPSAKVSVLIAPSTKDLVDGNPFIDEILVDNREGEHKGFLGYIKLVREISQNNFDLAVIFHTKKRTNLLCFVAGIPHRVGYKNNKFGFLLNMPVQDMRNTGEKHEVDYCLDVLKELGIDPFHGKIHVPLKEDSEQWATSWFKEQHLSAAEKIIALHPGSSDPSRRWPEKYFIEVIDQLAEKYHSDFIIVGDSQIQSVAVSIINKTDKTVIDLTGKTTISQLCSVLKRCNLLLSNDSGPVQIAAALGIPVVSIFTRNEPGINSERWRPYTEKSRVVSVSRFASQRVDTEQKISFAKSGPVDPQYLELIKTEQVLEAVDAIFKLC